MAGLAIAYTKQSSGSQTWNIVFKEFTTPDLPRQWENAASFQRSQTGALIQGGPRFQQKYIWTIDCLVDYEDAIKLDQLYKAWDYDRSVGKSVAVGITDATFGSAISTAATFASPPIITFAGPRKNLVNFGLVQV